MELMGKHLQEGVGKFVRCLRAKVTTGVMNEHIVLPGRMSIAS